MRRVALLRSLLASAQLILNTLAGAGIAGFEYVKANVYRVDSPRRYCVPKRDRAE